MSTLLLCKRAPLSGCAIHGQLQLTAAAAAYSTAPLCHSCQLSMARPPVQIIKVPAEEGIPDGLTIDKDGNLWVALGEGGAIVCYDPAQGKEVRRIKLPVKRVTSCTFGGPGLKTLYVTSRHEGRHLEAGEEASEHWGALFSVNIPGVSGARSALPVHLAGSQ